MVRNIGRQVALSFSEEATAYVLAASGGYPSLARQLCSLAYRRGGRQPGEVLLSKLEEAAVTFVDDPQYASFLDDNGLWGELGNERLWSDAVARANQEILATLAGHTGPVPRSVLVQAPNAGARRKALIGLVQLSVVRELPGSEPEYEMNFGLFRSWIRQSRLGLEA
jgi:hypothetical protein